MPNHNQTINLSEFEACVSQTVASVTDTKDPVFIALGDGTGVAIVDLKEYIELERLADLGALIEAHEGAQRDVAEGALVPWSAINEDWKRKDKDWKRKGDG